MGIFRGPNIIKSGLIMALDASSIRSYPGSGTIWYDLSGKNNHVTANGYVSNPVFQQTKGGRFFFDGETTKSYFQSSTYNGLSNILNCTIIVWAEWIPKSTNRYYAFDSRIGTPNYGAGIGLDKESSTTASPFHFFNDVSGYDESTSPNTFQQNTVYQLGVKRIGSDIQIIDTDSKTFTSPSLSSNTLGTSPISQMGPFRIGSYSGSGSGTSEYWWSGYIYAVLMYDRDLSNDEITQNYNVMKNKYQL